MSVTEFAMVEELALLVKDNLRSKHLILSMEETFVNFLLQEDDNSSSDGILELEPMDPYNRLLLHRLADIFGFAHVSVGEGDNRHLILERCAETSIPSILVSDILFQYDEPQSFITSHQLLRRDSSPVLKTNSPSVQTLEEREAAYLAARERIFSIDVGEMREPVKQKPRNVSVVARRMIAHALGQKIRTGQGVSVMDYKGDEVHFDKSNVQEKNKVDPKSSSESSSRTILSPERSMNSIGKVKNSHHKPGASSKSQKNLPKEPAEKSGEKVVLSQNGASTKKEYSKEEHLGAAKRMFANALGLQSAKGEVPARLSKAKGVEVE